MKFNNYISKLIILIVIGISSLNSNAQKIVMDSVSFPSPQVVCEQDTIAFYFVAGIDSSTGLPYFNPTIHVDLPDGFDFVDIVYNENISALQIPSSGIDASNSDDILFRWNGLMGRVFTNNPPYILELIVNPSCGANPSKSSAFITKGFGNTPISDTITTSTIQVLEPYLVFQGLSNTTNSNSTIDLTRLAIGQKIQRCFKVDYTSLISSIGILTVKVPNTTNYYTFDWVTPGVKDTVINDTVIYTFDAAFFSTIGDGDGLIEPGESFTFCDSVTVLGNCNSQNSNIKADYILQWGCGGNLCQNEYVAAEGVIKLSPTVLDIVDRPDLLIKPNLCDTCGTGMVKFGFEMINNTKPVLPTGGFLTNLIIELGTAAGQFSHLIPHYPILNANNYCFDSVRINGVTVPYTSTTNAIVTVANLTSFSGTGLADLDLDGVYDDLAVGDTLVVEIFGTFSTETHHEADLPENLSGGNINVNPSLIEHIKGTMDVKYSDECGGNDKEKRTVTTDAIYLNPTSSHSSLEPDFFDRGSYNLNMSVYEYNYSNNYICDSAIREIIVIVPKDVSLDTTLAYPFSNYPKSSNDSVIGWVEKDGLNDVDTIYVWYNTKGLTSYGTISSSIRLRYDCSGGICPEADSLRTVQWFQNYKCYNNSNDVCYTTAMHKGHRLIRFHCDQPPQGISLRTFQMERLTFGYSDSTETTKVNRLTPGIIKEAAMVADTVQVKLQGVVNNAVLDSAHVRFSYHTELGKAGVKQIFRVDPSSTVTIYDASTSTHHTFKLNAPGLFSGEYGPQQSGTTHDYDFQWNLSSYKDSIGAGYQFTGGLSNSATWDSIIMDIKLIVEDNTYSGYFHIDPYAQMVEYPTDTATQCDIYGGLFRIRQQYLTLDVQPNTSLSACNSVPHILRVRSGSGDHFPNEYRRNERLNEIRYSWNPEYFNDPDSVLIDYLWEPAHGSLRVRKLLSYTQTGNSIVIPLEKSINLNVLPETFTHYNNFVSVYQTPNCSVEDSTSSALFEIKGELDVTRFTNSSVTSTNVLYDTNSMYGGVHIMHVDPTPFNITSSPIVAAASSDSVCWEITYTNLSGSKIDYTWLDLFTDSIQITSIVRIDSGLSISQPMYSYGTNGLWIQTDSIDANDFKTYKVCAQYTSCELDSITLTGGWNCEVYPTDPESGYPPTAYSCEHNQQEVKIYIDELGAKLQVNMVNQTAMPIQICDTLSFDIGIANIDLTDVNDLVFSAILPAGSNLTNVSGSTKMLWPFDGTNTTLMNVADPTLTGDSLSWDLSTFFDNSFLRNYEIPNDSNMAKIHIEFNTMCNVIPDEDIRFNVQGVKGCGETIISKNIVSDPFSVLGLKKKANRAVLLNLTIDTIQACDTATQVDVAFYNVYAKNSRGSEVISVTFPSEFDISGMIFNGHRDTFLRSKVPTNMVSGGLRTLEWELLAGMSINAPNADSMSFSFNVTSITDINCSIDTLIEAKTFERYILYCVNDSSISCEVIYPLADVNRLFKVIKGEFDITNLSAVLNGCNDSIEVAFDYSNTGSVILAGTQTKFNVVADANANGIYDIADEIIDSIVTTNAIPKGSSGSFDLTLSQTQFSTGEVCDLFIMLDSSSSCICDTTYVQASVKIDMQLTDDTLCDNETANLNVCAGTGNYATRSYTWYDVNGLGRHIYLSDVNALSPTFDPPFVSTDSVFRYAIQVNRGGCVSEDTLEFLVKGAPNAFDILDDTICEDDCINLTTTMQAGVTYNVFDGLGSWLGTLPYVACPTSTSLYVIVANDSAAGCSSSKDSVTITVIKKQSPGTSSNVSSCGIGCTMNLFTALGGTPDTTGTWTDPMGNPFGTGYNAIFSSAVNLPGTYTYLIKNPPCNDTSATVTILQVTDTIRETIDEDDTLTLCPPILSTLSSIGSMSLDCPPTRGTITLDTASGCMTYVPNTNFVGNDTVCVVTCDSAGTTCDTSVVIITMKPVIDTVPVTIPEDSMFVICPPATTVVDAIGGVTLTCGPKHGTQSINPTTGCVTYTANPNYVGQDTICIRICNADGTCDTTIVPITIVPVQDTLTKYLKEDSSFTICAPEITDVDMIDSLKLSCDPSNGTISIDTAAGCITYTSSPNFVGYDTICFIKCDVNGVCDTTTVHIITGPVNDTLYRTINEDDTLTICPPVISNLGGTITSINAMCGGPDNGTFTSDISTGCIEYVPNMNYVGQDSICISTCDNLGNCDTTVVYITVVPVMDTIPVVIPEDSMFTICPPNTTDTDVLGAVTTVCGPNHGNVFINSITGCVTYTADPNYVGQDTICIRTCDINGVCDVTTIPVTITPVIDTLPIQLEEDEDTTLCPPVLTVVDVIDSVKIVCGPNNGSTAIDTTTSCVTYTPNPGYSGADTVCIVICDVNGVCDTSILVVNITPENDTVTLVTLEDIPVTTGSGVISGISPINKMTTIGGPKHGTVTTDPATGTITYTPDTNYVGYDTVTIVTCDTIANVCDTTLVTLTVLPVRDTVPMTIDEDDSFTVFPRTDSLTDVDSLGGTTVLDSAKFGAVMIDPTTGSVTYTAGTNFVGRDSVTVIVCDTINGFCDTTLFTIFVKPVIDSIPVSIDENGDTTICSPDLTVVDSVGSVRLICGPTIGTTMIDTFTSCIQYIANPSFSGNDTVCIVICDTAGVCDTSIIVIKINPVSDSVNVVTMEDIPLTVSPPVLSSLTPIGTMYTLNGPKHGTVTTDPSTGSITYTPDTNYVGYDTVSIIVCDTIAMVCDTTLVAITVLPVRDTVPMTIDEDDSFTVFPRTDSLTDVDSLGGTTVLDSAKFGAVMIDPTTGSVTYTAGTNFVGRDSVTVIVCDTINGFCDTTLFTIFVKPVRDTIINDTMEIDTSLQLCPPSITVVDSIGRMTALCPPMNGTVTFDSTSGCVTYTPTIGYAGPDTLCFVICDTAGVCDTTTLIVDILLDIDTLPVVIDEDTDTILCPPVTTRRRSIAMVDTVCSPMHGTVMLDTNGCVTYKPDTNYIGYDTVCIVTTDTNGRTDTTIITFTILPVKDTITLKVDEDDTLAIVPPTSTDFDSLGTVAVINGPRFGTVTTDPITGVVTYVPDTNFVGKDTIEIVITDGNGFSDTTRTVICVIPVRDTLYYSMPADSTLVVCMPTTTAVDSLGSATVLCLPSHGNATTNASGCLTYVGDPTYAGNDTLCVMICDTAGVCDTTTLIITLKRVFIPFSVADDSICEGDCVTLMADTMQSNVIYRVHSPVSTIIGRLPSTTVCPTSDSTFYIEAYDSITGVVSIWDTVTIFVTKFRSPGIDTTINLCATGSIVNLFDSLGGTPDTTGTWTDPLGNPFGTTYPGSYDPMSDTTGTFTYTVVNPVCPDTSATVTVIRYAAPEPGISDTLSFCQNGGTTDLFNSLGGSPDNTGNWSGPSTTTNGYLGELDLLTADTGVYWYKVTKFGCADDSAHIKVLIDTIEDPSIRMDDTALCKGLESAQVFILGATGGTFSMNSVLGDNITIDPVTGVITFSNRLPFRTRSGTYEVYYTTAGPCPEIETLVITITEYGEGCQIEIPQFISPNGDGINDKFVIPGIEEFPNNVLKIYNRWGNLVYEANRYNNNWEGKTNVNAGVNQVIGSGMLPVGTYFYIFEPNDDRYLPFSGYVYIKK